MAPSGGAGHLSFKHHGFNMSIVISLIILTPKTWFSGTFWEEKTMAEPTKKSCELWKVVARMPTVIVAMVDHVEFP